MNFRRIYDQQTNEFFIVGCMSYLVEPRVTDRVNVRDFFHCWSNCFSLEATFFSPDFLPLTRKFPERMKKQAGQEGPVLMIIFHTELGETERSKRFCQLDISNQFLQKKEKRTRTCTCAYTHTNIFLGCAFSRPGKYLLQN